MPLTLTLTEGVLPAGTERLAFRKICDSMLKWHGLSGNKVMTPNVIGAIHLLPKQHTYSGLTETDVAFIEWKVPSFAFNTAEIQQGHIEEATDIIHELSGGSLPKHQIWANVVHAVDGAWGIAGQALTNKQLGEALSTG
ncbi:MAG: 4-oxalocrotonate tautomerase [Methylomonas sp.]|nr:4-oxalocrotonate tautomerase [Methylomonas sp.]